MPFITQPTYEVLLQVATYTVASDIRSITIYVRVLFDSKKHAEVYAKDAYEELRLEISRLVAFHDNGDRVAHKSEAPIKQYCGNSQVLDLDFFIGNGGVPTFREVIDARTRSSITLQPTYYAVMEVNTVDRLLYDAFKVLDDQCMAVWDASGSSDSGRETYLLQTQPAYDAYRETLLPTKFAVMFDSMEHADEHAGTHYGELRDKLRLVIEDKFPHLTITSVESDFTYDGIHDTVGQPHFGEVVDMRTHVK